MIRNRAVRVTGAAPLILLMMAVLVAGCSESGTDVQSEPIDGTWIADSQGGTLYLVITADSLIYYTAADTEECADRYAYGLEPLGDDRYRLSSAVNTATLEVTITAAGGELRWDTGAGVAVFHEAANADPSTLDVCAGGGDDPALDCVSLPDLPFGQDLNGELSTTDSMERGRYYDVFALQPDSQMVVDITLTSSAFDAYLYVYEADGTLLAENDDAAEGSTNAALSLQVVPTCYRVEVTTFENEETGTYTLRAE